MKVSSENYLSYQEKSVRGRYVVQEQIAGFLEKKASRFKVRSEGSSVQNRSIESILIGTGNRKILMWSQMHGNESTTTKAVLDLINYLDQSHRSRLTAQEDLGSTLAQNLKSKSGSGGGIDLLSRSAVSILEHCTITILPMLNPDGATAYTRVNANQVDLNRDAAGRTQPESKVLRQVFDRFRPDYCFNLHDQRTIFNVGDTARPATVSFLAPSHDEHRSVSPSRLQSMRLVAAMDRELQKSIPGQIGRYDDTFNANCVGDAFQMTGTPTVLFEAGHFPGDYQREQTREYIFHALLTALTAISNDTLNEFEESDYLRIPENKKMFFDILVLNAHIINPTLEAGISIGLLYEEYLKNDSILFRPKIKKTGNLKPYFGHRTYNCEVPNDLEALKRQEDVFETIVNSR